jgi:predicted SprT family Zn-dependent metalloprotease
MNKITPKDLSKKEEKIVDWWVRYFQTELPFKITWNWKSESYDGDGICYRDKKEVRFKRSAITNMLKRNKQVDVRNIVAHEMAHFLHKGSAHKSGKFAGYKQRWNFKE